MKCPNCGTENDADAVFCKKCGTKIETQSSSEDISWVDKVDFTKGIDWGEQEDQPEQKKEEQGIEVDLSQKQRAQMWENLQRKKAESKEEDGEVSVMPGMNKKRPAASAQPPKPEKEPSVDSLYDDEDDYDFDEYDYQDEDGTGDGGKPPVGLFVGIIGVVAAILVLAIVLFNVFSSKSGGYVPATRPTANPSLAAETTAAEESAPMSATAAADTTEERTTQAPTTQESTTAAPETTQAQTTEEETTQAQTTEEETTEEETAEPDPDPVVQDGLTYHFHDGEAYVGKYTGDAAEIYVASEVNGYPVRYIDADAFSDCYSLQRLYLPEGVVEIGENALYNCTSLNQIVLPSTLTEIGQGAFDYCPAFTIIGQEGTYAQQFANLYHVNFVPGSAFEE